MYEYIRGIVTDVQPTHAVIEAGGIGYHVLIANPFRLSDSLNKEATVYLYQSLSQDQLRLYGFINALEKDLFLRLIGVSGIGPKSALSILALEDHVGLAQAIEDGDTKYLQKFPGVGKKTASQIILDLKGKLADLSPELVATFGTEQDAARAKESAALVDAMEALEVLGFTQRDRKRVRPLLEQEDLATTDEYIRQALHLLMTE